MKNSHKRPEIYRETITGCIESDLRHCARSTQVQFHPTEKTWQISDVWADFYGKTWENEGYWRFLWRNHK